jgi:hypothetical protein
MNTATMKATKQFQSFTWQALKKLTKEIGVQFYNKETQYHRNGYGLRVSGGRWEDDTKLVIEPNLSLASRHDTQWLDMKIAELSHQNFLMKIELWALKNNVEYVYTPKSGYNDGYIQIVKVGA